MKNELLDVSGNTGHFGLPDTALSFHPFIQFLRGRAGREKTIKGEFYRQVLGRFEAHKDSEGKIAMEDIHEYEVFMELMYSCLSPVVADENSLAWGLCPPFRPFIFYGTESLYGLLWNTAEQSINTGFFSKNRDTYAQENLRLAYTLILQRLYGFNSPVKASEPSAYTDPATGIEKYYQVHIDTRFIDVSARDELPELNVSRLYSQLNDQKGYQMLEKVIPLDLFRFTGISVVTITDVTKRYALENIKKSWILHTSGNEAANYNHVIRALKMLVGDNAIEFELFPFFRVNNKLVYAYEKGGPSLLKSVWGEERLAPDRFHAEAEGYSSHPVSFFSKNIWEESDDEYGMLALFKPYNICSLALQPVFLNHKPVGVLGLYTAKGKEFDEQILSMVEEAMPSLAQLLQVYIDEFNLEIESIIKEKFTSVQSPVQWKFNEAAWHFLYKKKKGVVAAEIEPVVFDQVYPLYGAVDIRNSTVERNKAIKADLKQQLSLLSETFGKIKKHQDPSLLDEINFKCQKWLDLVLSENPLKANQETQLDHFLTREAVLFLEHVMQSDANTRPAVTAYLQNIDQGNANVSPNRRDLELSMKMINTAIGHYLDSEKKEIQMSFPCYFEKFKTDGVEYDIYIGQSIAPEKPFDNFHIKNLRLWQLKSMAAMAKIAHSQLPQMPKKLYTTQLIFAHSKVIDISFRSDERRFDVEGDYNIRYQMIKKRIDKVRVRHSSERLTQPGKIALVYLDKSDVEDYVRHIDYLQEIKLLENNLEEIDLEDLQGIDGLKALRVGVSYG